MKKILAKLIDVFDRYPVAIIAIVVVIATLMCSCVTNPYTPPPPDDCYPFLDEDFVNPPRPNPAWRAGGLILGDIKAKRLASRRTLKAPPGWDAPDRIDNSAYCTPLENQGQTPWCAAYSMGQLLSASYWREFHQRHDFPEDQLYAMAKRIDGGRGEGTTLESIMQAARLVDFGLSVKPTLDEADIQEVYEIDDVLFAVHKYGLVLVGLQITDGWNNLTPEKTIGPGTEPIGGHALLVSGYSRKCNLIWGPNWWGRSWGQNGWWMMTLDQFEAQLGYGYAIRIRWEAKQ